MEEFLESCRATSLLAKLEDVEELLDADVDENEEDCDDSEELEDNYNEERLSSHNIRHRFGKKKHWDADHVIKRKLSLTLRGPNLPGVPDIEVDLNRMQGRHRDPGLQVQGEHQADT